jgi:hypothetical protein
VIRLLRVHLLVALAGLLLTQGVGRADIAFDVASSATTTADTLTFTHTIGSGTNRLLVVCVGIE